MSEARTTGPLQRLIQELKRLPGIGARTAERLAFHLLKAPTDEALALADAIRATKEQVRPCQQCFNLAETDLCTICADPRRDSSTIIVVEQPKDLIALESTGVIGSVYHVLMGRIAPLEGITPRDLTLDKLVQRVRAGGVNEVILATNPTVEGDATALHVIELLSPLGVRVTRLARGIAPGSHIEYANRSMLEEAFRNRQHA